MRTEYKTTTWRHIKQGDVINYFKHGHTTTMGEYYVAEANVARITLWPAMSDGTYNHTNPLYCDPETFQLMVEMTDSELRDKYYSKAKEIVNRLQRTIPLGDIGYHEMWNGWLGLDAYEFAQACVDKEFEIVGVCYEIDPKPGVVDLAWAYDVGIVCEYNDDHQRFWCHYKSDYLNNIFDEWKVKR